ncbi:hypothetical protein [Paracoccus laeviglucosivorans]|uniref:Uncharacterized protein n=1 Tax=Paracoccus laeviglucosivorans TaxID=1197861 RepID=A0A521CWX6_9RHOB|nr:hypothetical protein [Paracoccus laeviglucosivorans]SMO63949.1 hypothetical protein SAMN06265221_105232 [Paracoccus laeviglucosivorans]
MTLPNAEAKARVDVLLIQPLAGLGYKRKRGASANAQDEMLDRLRGRLAYMTDANLRGMVDLILRHAVKGQWPDEGLIRAWAYTLQCPPPRDCDYAMSLIRSAMGRAARDEGWAVELFQIAKRIGPPPGRYIIAQLKDEAEQNRRRRIVISENIQAGLASDADKAWLAEWHQDMADIEAIQSGQAEGQAA